MLCETSIATRYYTTTRVYIFHRYATLISTDATALLIDLINARR
jgi:hypothetical protein